MGDAAIVALYRGHAAESSEDPKSDILRQRMHSGKIPTHD
jgi:hypothetical protein